LQKFLEEALAMVDGLGVPIGKTIIKVHQFILARPKTYVPVFWNERTL
jgi:hypothetical protein